MGTTSVKYARAERDEEPKTGKPALPPQERKALKTLRREARKAGATLATNGEGGLPPSLVLGVMRRDGYRCKVCGSKKNLGIHHKGGLENPTSKWLKKMGHKNIPKNLVTICEESHDEVHEEDRSRG